MADLDTGPARGGRTASPAAEDAAPRSIPAHSAGGPTGTPAAASHNPPELPTGANSKFAGPAAAASAASAPGGSLPSVRRSPPPSLRGPRVQRGGKTPPGASRPRGAPVGPPRPHSPRPLRPTPRQRARRHTHPPEPARPSLRSRRAPRPPPRSTASLHSLAPQPRSTASLHSLAPQPRSTASLGGCPRGRWEPGFPPEAGLAPVLRPRPGAASPACTASPETRHSPRSFCDSGRGGLFGRDARQFALSRFRLRYPEESIASGKTLPFSGEVGAARRTRQVSSTSVKCITLQYYDLENKNERTKVLVVYYRKQKFEGKRLINIWHINLENSYVDHKAASV
ncbi:translation initiation factor IF-2-like [Canis lupus dingo]|uniref:translation initiation factor IF-2-like n=1 Tax=Canis lupus dingo TaxID=286419 RepID=UPI0020C54458|nr:translation initiation factor IF-2-like [Canis lupus dingo]